MISFFSLGQPIANIAPTVIVLLIILIILGIISSRNHGAVRFQSNRVVRTRRNQTLRFPNPFPNGCQLRSCVCLSFLVKGTYRFLQPLLLFLYSFQGFADCFLLLCFFPFLLPKALLRLMAS